MQNNRIHELLQIFKAMANKNRLLILDNLLNNEMNVSELASMLDVQQSNASHDLAILRESGLISMRKNGKHRIAMVNKKTIEAFFQTANTHLNTEE